VIFKVARELTGEEQYKTAKCPHSPHKMQNTLRSEI